MADFEMTATTETGRKVYTSEAIINFLEALASGEFDREPVPQAELDARREHLQYVKDNARFMPSLEPLTAEEIARGQKVWAEYVAEHPEVEVRAHAGA